MLEKVSKRIKTDKIELNIILKKEVFKKAKPWKKLEMMNNRQAEIQAIRSKLKDEEELVEFLESCEHFNINYDVNKEHIIEYGEQIQKEFQKIRGKKSRPKTTQKSDQKVEMISRNNYE
jgi:PHD-finger